MPRRGGQRKAESRQSHEICIMATKANKSKAAEEEEAEAEEEDEEQQQKKTD